MTPERWARVKDLFSTAADLPAAERAAFLAREAADDAGLIDEVSSLLVSHEAPGAFLEPVPPQLRSEALEAGHANHLGERIGAYRIVEMIGTGGMGDVYKAVRDDDQYRAEVAIKLMRADVRNPLAERRFRTERQILAQLDHRNIARLLDGGTTPHGLPYVVMELVTGEPVDQYCEARQLTARERVQLFLQVCAAVSYAHQHLVVHRDLKPNNIHVTADGSVKLLDFGIAKLLETEAPTEDRDATVTHMRAMTLEYASPEQVSGGTVTTVSDVYSLGVVLYRLLTGKSPYRPQTNDAQRMAEILGDTTPTRPSQVRQLDGDLDHILLKALRKEPQKRYGSVEQFATDLRHFLVGLPVAARRGTWGYRAAKFARRNRIPIAAAVVVTLSLVGGLWIAIHEAREAERQRAIAQRHFDSVRSLASKLIDFNAEIEKLPGSTRAREILVTTSLQYLDTLYQETGTDPKLQEELGIAYQKVAEIQGSQLDANVGDPKAALKSYAKSNALLEPLLAKDPGNSHLGAVLGESYMRQARTLLYTQGPREAIPAAEKAVRYLEPSRDGFRSETLYVGILGDAYAVLAHSLGVSERHQEALVPLEKLVRLSEEFTRAHPDDIKGMQSLAKAYINSAITDDPDENEAQKLARVEPMYLKAMDIQGRLVASDTANASYRWNLGETQYNYGDLLYDNGQYAKALDLFRKASMAFVGFDPNDARAIMVNAMNDVNLAKALVVDRQFSEARTVNARVDPVLRKLNKEGSTIQIEWALGQMGIARGQMLIALAEDPRMSHVQRSALLRNSRDSLREGITYIESVNKAITLFGVYKKTWDDGLASLAQAEAALASL